MIVSALSPKEQCVKFKSLYSVHNQKTNSTVPKIRSQKKLNNANIFFGNTPSIISNQDIYPIHYIEKYVNAQTIQNAIKTNDNISKILAKYGLKPNFYPANIDSRAKNHLFSTYMYARDISQMMQLNEEDSSILYRAALLHDIGKALIPDSIIQKPGKLTPEERKIVDLHAQLGYEIIKTTDIPEEIADAVRTHHVPIFKKQNDIISQILSIADVYSALKEERAYKPVLSDETAFAIMKETKGLAQDIISNFELYKSIV